MAQDLVINEVDADQAGSDSGEFVELYDGGQGNTPLEGLVIVFFNGNNDSAYLAFDLDGYSTNEDGLFVAGNPGVPNVSLVFAPGTTGALQNGPDAVALFAGDASDFPSSTPVTSDNLIDALVYGTDDPDASGLLDVLTPGQDQINDTAAESMARVPDGGTARETATYINQAPSPGLRNKADENLNLGISIAPQTISESATTPAIATISRTGPTTSPATLLIDVSDPSEVFMDATAEFGIGESSITVELLPVDDLWADGTQTVTITVREENNALNPAEASIDIEDDGDENAMVVNEVYPSVDSFSGDANKDGEILNSLDEFVELVNASDAPYDLSGFTLQDAVAVRHTFPAGTIVDPGCAIVVFGGGNLQEGLLEEFGNAFVQKANGANEFGLSLNNSGDIVTIRNLDDLEVAGASWGEVSPADGSLTRDPDITGNFDSHAAIGFDSFGPGFDINGDPFCEITLTLSLAVTPSTIVENAGATASTLTITRTGSTAQTIVVTLTNDDPSEISLPAEVTIPAGQSSAMVSIAAVNDEAQDGTQSVIISASAPGYVLDSATIDVTDDGDEPVDVVINEFDSDQDGTDTMEFIELYDGGTGNLPLDGLIVVLFNGANDTSYATIDLNGQSTDANGFLVLGSAEVPSVTFPIDDFQLQNGADAIAVYRDDADNFPNGTFVSFDNLVDAVVYGTGDPDAFGLLDALTPDGIQVDEGDANNGNAVARVPDGGLPFDTTTFVTQPPTPGRLNEAVDNIVAIANPSTLAESTTTPVTLNLSRTGPTDREVVVDIAIDDPTELTGAATATFAIGQAAVTVQLFAVDDLWPDGDQAVTVTVSAADASLKSATITMTVTDDSNDAPELVINEIHAAVDADVGDANKDGSLATLGFDEFVELVNTSGAPLDISGYTISDSVAPRHTFPAGTTLDTDCAVVVFGGGNIAEGILPQFGNALVQKANLNNEFGLGLNDGGDTLSIKNAAGREAAATSWEELDAGNGSLTRLPDLTGDFVEHFNVGNGDNLFSPGTKVTGEPFCVIVNELTLEIAPATFAENAGAAAAQLTVTRSGSTAAALVVSLQSSDPTEAATPPTVTIPAGSSSTTAAVNAVDDAGPDGTQQLTITASADGFVSASVGLSVTDDGDEPVDIVINEIDPDQTGIDTGEFVELYDGGRGNVPLDGFIVVLFNGSSGTSYTAVDLAGQMTNANGFFVLGSPDLAQSDLAFAAATNAIQNAGDAVDAVAIYRDTIDNFPTGTSATDTNLVDALVYGNADATDDNDLLDILTPAGTRMDENPDSTTNAIARVPDGGAAFDTSLYRRQSPTPGASNGEGGELGFDLWALQYPGIGGPTANGDNDPMTNALEYALGLNPRANDIASLPAPSLNANGKLEFTIDKGTIAGSDARLSYTVEVSANQIDWTTTGTTVNTNTASILSVIYTGTAKEIYMRLRVSLTL
ncbi:MAG: lamin tail domain-containing protein [Verrucomicrobiales bacterium]